MTADAQTPNDPFNCPDCGSHDYGLYALQFGGCPHCMKRELAAVRGQLEEAQKHCDRLTGMKFSDRMHAALVDRAERAESALAAAKEGIAALMIKHGMATGHGDTCADLLRLLEGELAAAKAEAEALREKLHNISNEFPAVYQRGLRDGIKEERERCARICAEQERLHQMTDDKAAIRQVLYAIRAEAEKEGK